MTYAAPTSRGWRRQTNSNAAKTRTTAASCHKYAIGDHQPTTMWCPAEPRALTSSRTSARLTAFMSAASSTNQVHAFQQRHGDDAAGAALAPDPVVNDHAGRRRIGVDGGAI